MRRSVYALAALVTAALDRVLPASAVLLSRGDSEEVDTAGVIDTEGRRWVVRAPRTAGAGIRTEAESRIAQALAKSNIGQLIAQPEASLSYGDARATVYPALPGRPLDLAEVEESEALARALGHAIGLIHSVPIYMAQGSGIPEMSAHELRERARRAVSRAGWLPALFPWCGPPRAATPCPSRACRCAHPGSHRHPPGVRGAASCVPRAGRHPARPARRERSVRGWPGGDSRRPPPAPSPVNRRAARHGVRPRRYPAPRRRNAQSKAPPPPVPAPAG
ncbi:phosphotransferase [Dermabacteraceae bacterium P13101]